MILLQMMQASRKMAINLFVKFNYIYFDVGSNKAPGTCLVCVYVT